MAKEVPFDGPKDAPYYLIGEAPGRQEVEKGKPFVGGAGNILRKLLSESGIGRFECRIANVMRIKPPKNNFNIFSQHEVEAGIEYLKRDIGECSPKVLVPLGNHALKAVYGVTGITNWRGSILWSDEFKCKVIPTVHPSFIQGGNWEYAPISRFDFSLMREEVDKPFDPPLYNLRTGMTFGETIQEIDRLKQSEYLAFDLETTRAQAGGNAIITAVGFSDELGYACSIPFMKGLQSAWTAREEFRILEAIKELLETPSIKVIAHNSQFDMGVLAYTYGICVANLWRDTMCVAHVLHPELPKALAFVRSLYTKQPYYDHWSSLGGDWFLRYNAMDAAMAFEIAMNMEPRLEALELTTVYDKLVGNLIPVLMGMQIRGMKVDDTKRDAARKFLEQELIDTQHELDALAGETVDALSPKMLGNLLYNKMGLPTQFSKTTGKPTTNEAALMKLSKKYPSKMFSCIIKIRGCRKTISTYLDASLVDGRMHTSYNIGGRIKDNRGRVASAPETGRISSSRSIVVGSGTNLQNIPHGVCRTMFVADPPKVLVSVDLSQAEARVVAWLAEEDKMIEVFEGGRDIHRLNASWIFGAPYESVEPDQRQFAKKHVHAFNYGEGIRTFASISGLTSADARSVQESYFKAFPRILLWQRRTVAELGKTRIMTTPFGRRRKFHWVWGEELFKKAYAYVPQSTVADILNQALIKMDNWIKESGWDIQLLLQVHDSLILQCMPDKVGRVVEAMNEVFNIPVEIHGRELLIPHDVKVGPNWEELAEWVK